MPQCSDVHLLFTPWAIHINLLQQHQPPCWWCVLSWGLQAEGSSDIIFSACFWASCKCRWRKRFTKLNKKGGLIRNAKTACWSSIGCAGSEAPVLLPESFSTMRVGCSSCPYPQLHRNVRDFHSKTLICPWLMSGRMPLVTAEKDWTTYAALVTSIPGLPVHGLLEERRDTTWLCLQ